LRPAAGKLELQTCGSESQQTERALVHGTPVFDGPREMWYSLTNRVIAFAFWKTAGFEDWAELT
jgi:hypothetical protein